MKEEIDITISLTQAYSSPICSWGSIFDRIASVTFLPNPNSFSISSSSILIISSHCSLFPRNIYIINSIAPTFL